MRLSATCLLTLCALAGGIHAGDAPVVAPTAPATAPAPVAPRPVLGVSIDETAAAFDGSGLPVVTVHSNTAAAAMGVVVGDRITAINGQKMAKIEDLYRFMGGAKVGDSVTLDVLRRAGGKEEKLSLTGALTTRARPVVIGDELRDARDRLRKLAEEQDRKRREPSLAEILQSLKDIEEALPAAAAAFKKQYPDGEFDINISIRITSDKKAKNPVEITNRPEGASATSAKPAPAPAPAPEPKR